MTKKEQFDFSKTRGMTPTEEYKAYKAWERAKKRKRSEFKMKPSPKGQTAQTLARDTYDDLLRQRDDLTKTIRKHKKQGGSIEDQIYYENKRIYMNRELAKMRRKGYNTAPKGPGTVKVSLGREMEARFRRGFNR